LSAAVILSVLFGLIWLDVYIGQSFQVIGLVFCAIMLLVAVMAGEEVRWMWVKRNDCPVAWVVASGMLLTVGFSCVPVLWQQYPADCHIGKIGWTLLGLAASVGIAFLHEMRIYDRNDESVIVSGRLSKTIMIFSYVGLLLSFLSALRFFGNNQLGMLAFVSVPAVVKISDSGAYFVGKAIGRTRITPNLSPGKSLEGFAGGILGGVGGAFVVFYLIAPHVFAQSQTFRWWGVLIFGVLVTIAGVVGDLAESLVKRESRTKDSSSWLPGLGGVMDIIDSVVVAAPMGFAIWASGILIAE